jgi:hypothetical protein
MDNYAAHKRVEIRDWLTANPRVHVHFTPTSASWMNLVEVWFGIIERQAIHRGTFRSVRELTRKIRDFIDGWNGRAHPSSGPRPPTKSSLKPTVKQLQTRTTRREIRGDQQSEATDEKAKGRIWRAEYTRPPVLVGSCAQAGRETVSRRGWAKPSSLDGEFSPACTVTDDLKGSSINSTSACGWKRSATPEPKTPPADDPAEAYLVIVSTTAWFVRT